MSNTAIVNSLNSQNIRYDISLFVQSKERKSKDTANTYKRHINEALEFFNMKNYITELDIQEIKHKNVLQFVSHLENKKNSPLTIENKLAATKSLWSHLSKDYNVNPSIWDVDLDTSDSKSHPEFTEEEWIWFLEFCEEQECKGNVKKLFFETLYVTGLRKTAALNLEWNNIVQEKDNDGSLVWVIKTKDKGNSHQVIPISDDFYNSLLSLKEKDSNKLFNINEKTLYKTISQFKDAFSIEKKLTIHSVKSTSLTKAWIRTKDIKKVQEQGHHKDPTTTLKKYVRNEQSLKSKISYSMDKDTQVNLEDLSKEELLSLINKCSDRVKEELISYL